MLFPRNLTNFSLLLSKLCFFDLKTYAVVSMLTKPASDNSEIN